MRYRSSELDALIDRFFVTVPRQERTQVLGQIVHHMTDQAIPVGLFYNVAPVMIGNRLQNVTAGGPSSGPAWNANEWDIR
jgi:hypothetical protein